MRIDLSKTLVEFTPEADYEKTMLEGLWRMLVDCARFNQKLVPVGEYVPAKNNTASFAVEGDKGEDALENINELGVDHHYEDHDEYGGHFSFRLVVDSYQLVKEIIFKRTQEPVRTDGEEEDC